MLWRLAMSLSQLPCQYLYSCTSKASKTEHLVALAAAEAGSEPHDARPLLQRHLYACPHTTICALILLYVSSCYYIYVCAHTATCWQLRASRSMQAIGELPLA